MIKAIHIFVLIFLGSFFSISACAEVAGKWRFSVSNEMGTTYADVDMLLDGSVLTGTVVSEWGEYTLLGQANGDKFIFRVLFQAQGQEVFIDYDGEVKGDTIEGTLNFADLFNTPFKGVKVSSTP